MKRLIPALIIFVMLLSLTIYSHFIVNSYCQTTINDIERFSKQTISGDDLTNLWSERKKKMAVFVNHDFLDQISLYIGQLTLGSSSKDENFSVAYKNIETLLTIIKEDQRLAAHNFY